MRTFVVVSHTAPLNGDFSLTDLPGGAGRLDILCRCAVEAFLVSHGIRKDTRLYFSIRDQLVVTMEGERLRHLNPDERSTAALLRRALARGSVVGPGETVESTSGISVERAGLAKLLQALREEGRYLILLAESGVPLLQAPLAGHPAFILSDHCEFEPEERELLDELPRVSVGPRWLHGHQCITLVHSELDQREAGWTSGLG
ncbi:MAG: tRNA (pseudouridine(54)-N(1))-methyltransferase TrmY [Candidatus Bipolaricaulota bacterium]